MTCYDNPPTEACVNGAPDGWTVAQSLPPCNEVDRTIPGYACFGCGAGAPSDPYFEDHDLPDGGEDWQWRALEQPQKRFLQGLDSDREL